MGRSAKVRHRRRRRQARAAQRRFQLLATAPTLGLWERLGGGQVNGQPADAVLDTAALYDEE